MSRAVAAVKLTRGALVVLVGQQGRKHTFPVLLLFGCGLCLVGLAGLRYPYSRISGDIVFRAVSMTLGSGIDVEPNLMLDASRAVRLDRFDVLSPAAGVPADTRSAILLGGDETEIAALHLAQGSSLAVDLAPVQNGKGWTLQLLMGAPGGASVEIQASAGATLIPRETESWAPGVVRISTQGASAVPMRLQATLPRIKGDPTSPDGPSLLENVPVSALRFGRENGRTGNNAFTSSIVRGSITLIDTADKQELQIGSPLTLTKFAGSISRLSFQEDGMHLLFYGHALSVDLGQEDFIRHLTPSWLDIAYHTTWTRLFGAALGLVLAAWLTIAFANQKST